MKTSSVKLKQPARDEIAKLTEEFLRNGGKIQKLGTTLRDKNGNHYS